MIRRLEVDGYGVMDEGLDPFSSEGFLEPISIGSPENEQVSNRLGTGLRPHDGDRGIC